MCIYENCYFKMFLVACTRLYKPLSRWVGLFTKHATYGDWPCFLIRCLCLQYSLPDVLKTGNDQGIMTLEQMKKLTVSSCVCK